MNKIKQYIEEREKEFENELLFSFPPNVEPKSVIGYAENEHLMYQGKAIDIKSYTSQTINGLIDLIIKEIEGLKKSNKYANNADYENGAMEALQDIKQSLLNSK